MTRDTPLPLRGGMGHGNTEMDLLAGLWREAPFARLPIDAPTELRDLVEVIQSPKNVYTIHRARRRHGFQQLVQQYIVQLREGCGDQSCLTPTCFTCRKRIVGKAPIRRYNPTSARTLAIYLASQDNPEEGLCPGLKCSRGPPAAMRSLIVAKARPASSLHEVDHQHPASDMAKDRTEESWTLKERPVMKDHRSFAANMFETAAFKMLEWLTPSGIQELSKKTGPPEDEEACRCDTGPKSRNNTDEEALSSAGRQTQHNDPQTLETADEGTDLSGATKCMEYSNFKGPAPRDAIPVESPRNDQLSIRDSEPMRKQEPCHGAEEIPSNPPSRSRRNSKATVRTSNGSKPRRQLSLDAYSQDVIPDDPLSTSLRSPLLGSHGDKNAWPGKPGNGTLPRPISQLTTAGYFDHVSLQEMPSPKTPEVKVKLGRSQVDGTRSSLSSSPREPVAGTGDSSETASDQYHQAVELDIDSSLESHLPQALDRMSPDIVDFFCDVLQDYGVAEKHMLHPKTVSALHLRQRGQTKTLKRLKARSRPGTAPNLRREWALFIEQTMFYVLSNPRRNLQSFTEMGLLYDSQTLWYCMVRLTRVAPSLVFHSLWLASASLFAPPDSLRAVQCPTGRLFPGHMNSMSNENAGYLLSICLHALVASAPLLSDSGSDHMYHLSRLRAQGSSLAGGVAVAQAPADSCLKVDDVFSNDLALRLAKRVFSAITARRTFDDLTHSNLDPGHPAERDIFSPLISQLDWMNFDATNRLHFSVNDYAFHEVRVGALILDWARAVMMREWNGNPEVPADGALGGALALINALYQKRLNLNLDDSQFRAEYFAERLDPIEMPVEWVAQVSTKQKVHLLDFPYLFTPATLVSYFRSINFSRMSRAYEQAQSLHSRMQTIMMQGNLIMQVRHKEVLQEMLHTASSRYLVLSIDRGNVIKNSFDQLWRREERELLRPLKIHLGEDQGELGFDSGGVQQEYFRLAFAEVLDPAYGAFTVDERTHMTWFRPSSPEPLWKFELVGLLISLAIYNGLTLPVTFPRALYRKLLGEPVTDLRHIEDGWPDLANGLSQLIQWDENDGLVEDVFARTYEFSVESFGKTITREMKSAASEIEPWPQFQDTAKEPDSEAPLVTGADRFAYVDDYIRYLTDVSVLPQYEAFARGFRTCFHPKSLTLLSSDILQPLAEGVQEIDVAELRRYARYIGFDAGDRTVKDFWSIVKRYDDRMKRRLLEFVTASDRLPVGGVKNLNMTIQKNGVYVEDVPRLPTAYTCYSTLLLPEYKDKDTLRERLAMALENSQGFGFA